jgi:hypothetical protein
LCECGYEEEEVVEELELIEEHFGNEGEDIVLGIFDDVVLVVLGLHFSLQRDGSLAHLDILTAVLLESFKESSLGLRLLL